MTPGCTQTIITSGSQELMEIWGEKCHCYPIANMLTLNHGCAHPRLFYAPKAASICAVGWKGRPPPLHNFIHEDLEVPKGRHIAAFACRSGSQAEKVLRKRKACLDIEKLKRNWC